MEITMKNFANACQAAYEAQRLLEQTQKVYNFLETYRGMDFSPKEIGMAVIGTRYPSSDVKRVTDSLYWLYDMGLVGYRDYEKIITIKAPYPEKVRDVKIINGVEYVGYIEKDTIDVKKVYRRWFTL